MYVHQSPTTPSYRICPSHHADGSGLSPSFSSNERTQNQGWDFHKRPHINFVPQETVEALDTPLPYIIPILKRSKTCTFNSFEGWGGFEVAGPWCALSFVFSCRWKKEGGFTYRDMRFIVSYHPANPAYQVNSMERDVPSIFFLLTLLFLRRLMLRYFPIEVWCINHGSCAIVAWVWIDRLHKVSRLRKI